MPLITFDYPVVNFKTKQHAGDLRIIAMAVLYQDGSLAGTQTMKVLFENTNILRLVQAISPDEYENIEKAATAHGEYLYGVKEEPLTETLYSIVQKQENKLS